MKFKKIGALILGAILTIGVAAGLGAKVEDEKAFAADPMVTMTLSGGVLGTDSSYVSNERTETVTGYGITWNNLNPKTGQVRGNQTSATNMISGKNFYAFNTIALPGAITQIKLNLLNGTLVNNNIYAIVGDSTITSLTTTSGTKSTSGTNCVTWTFNSNSTAKYFGVGFQKGATSGTVTCSSLEITYQNQNTSTPTLSGISAKLNDTTKKWYVEDTVTLDDIIVTATYSDSTDKSVITGVALTNNILKNVGENVINISYTENSVTKTTTLTVNAQAQRELIGVTLKGDMTKKEYNVGDSWDLSGLYLDLSYSVGENETIPLTDLTADEDYILSEDKASDTSITSLDIYGEYEGFEFEIPITGIKVNDVKTYTLVTDINSLSIGSEVIIAANGYDKALSTTQSNNNRSATDITKTNENKSISAPAADVQIFTLENGITAGTYAFNTGSGYIYAASSGSNYLRTQTTNDANGSWNIEITSEGVATIKATGSYTRNWLRYNNSNSIFSCYSSGQADVSLYQYLKPVEKLTVSSLDITTKPNKMIYSVGEDFDPEGMVVTATYSNGTPEDVTSKCAFNPEVIDENTNQITITYEYEDVPYTTTLDITLKAVKDVISVASKPNIYVDDVIDAGQFELNVEYNDNTTGTVQADEVDLDTTTAGVKEATATYNGASGTKTVTFEIEVYGLTSLSWTNRGDHVAFEGSTLGEAFNTAEWKFTAKYNDENKTQLEPSPVFGTGENDVRVSLYEKGNPTEENTPLDVNYMFTLEDDGKYLVVCYKGIFSSNNHRIDIVEELNDINKEVTIQTEGKAITFNLGDDGEATHKDGSTAKDTYSETVDDYSLSITGGNKMYPGSFDAAGNGAIKLGTGSAAGGFSFAVPEGIIKVDILAAKYKTNAATLTINNKTYTLTKNSNDGAYDVIQIDTSTTKTITLEVTSGYRAMVNSIVFYTAGQTTTQTLNYANNNLMAQAAVMEFVNFFNNTMTGEGVCNVNGNTDYTTDTFIAAWELVANKWDELFGENTDLSSDDLAYAKEMFVYADSHWESEEFGTDPLQRAMRTYDKVTSNTNLSKFIEGRPKVEDNGVGIKALIDDNASTIALIVIIALFSGFAFLFVSKRKQRKIEL